MCAVVVLYLRLSSRRQLCRFSLSMLGHHQHAKHKETKQNTHTHTHQRLCKHTQTLMHVMRTHTHNYIYVYIYIYIYIYSEGTLVYRVNAHIRQVPFMLLTSSTMHVMKGLYTRVRCIYTLFYLCYVFFSGAKRYVLSVVLCQTLCVLFRC